MRSDLVSSHKGGKAPRQLSREPLPRSRGSRPLPHHRDQPRYLPDRADGTSRTHQPGTRRRPRNPRQRPMVSQRHRRHALPARLDRRITTPRRAPKPLPHRHRHIPRLSTTGPLRESRGNEHRRMGNHRREPRASRSTRFRARHERRSTLSHGTWPGKRLALLSNTPHEHHLAGGAAHLPIDASGVCTMGSGLEAD